MSMRQQERPLATTSLRARAEHRLIVCAIFAVQKMPTALRANVKTPTAPAVDPCPFRCPADAEA
jgi:hypothetical protein